MTLTRTIFIALALTLPTTWTIAMAGDEAAPTEEAKPAKKGKKAKKAEGEKAPEGAAEKK